MIVCLCEGVSDRTIKQAITKGSETIADLRSTCGAGSGCGMCLRQLRGLLDARAHHREATAQTSAAA